MSELMTALLPAVRCTEAMKSQLETIVEATPGGLADHIRHAVELYIDAETHGVSGILKRVAAEMNQAHVLQLPATEAATIMRLADHWDRTKRDSYAVN